MWVDRFWGLLIDRLVVFLLSFGYFGNVFKFFSLLVYHLLCSRHMFFSGIFSLFSILCVCFRVAFGFLDAVPRARSREVCLALW